MATGGTTGSAATWAFDGTWFDLETDVTREKYLRQYISGEYVVEETIVKTITRNLERKITSSEALVNSAADPILDSGASSNYFPSGFTQPDSPAGLAGWFSLKPVRVDATFSTDGVATVTLLTESQESQPELKDSTRRRIKIDERAT